VCQQRMKHPSARFVGVDLLAVEPFPLDSRISIVQNDFTRPDTSGEIRRLIGDRKVDTVLSDLAPSTTGDFSADHYKQMHLTRLAFDFALNHLSPDAKNSAFLCKIFMGGEEKEFAEQVRARFTRIKWIKPPSCRSESREVFLFANP